RALAQGLPIRFDTLDRAQDWGLDPDAAARRLHVWHRGEILSGLPAFRALWAAMPGMRWAAQVTGLPVIRPAATFLYDRVAAPLLYAAHRRRVSRSG
ncbi:DCC1-like thiol-disulfide oxidoreductase family protein, partial [Aphanothece microscopica]|uniref:DCC1-like thiol-disulfide oxidoreductase family protein n=1 Tax=Aphanothece microscopica TaxID=1049561 RepID=UPI003985423E